MKLDLYVITDEDVAGGLSHVEIAQRAILGGADVIQLRDKACGSGDLLRIGRVIREITRKTGTLFIVNDRLDVALACGADGVHLGQDDLCVGVARQIAPDGFIIGVSVGTLEEAILAEREGADYLALVRYFPPLRSIIPARSWSWNITGYAAEHINSYHRHRGYQHRKCK